MKPYHYILILLVSLIISFLLYGNSISGEFVYDDNFFANRQDLKEASHLLKVWTEPYLPNNITTGLFRPVTVFTFNLNFVLFGSSPITFHIVNIILNGIVIFLTFILCQKLFKNLVLSLFITLFWAFLPIHTEAVANIKGREEILAALFGILAWLTFISATEDRQKVSYRKICLLSLLFLLAVLSKELVIMLPVLFILAFIFRKKPNFLELGKIIVIFALTGSLYMFWRYLVLGEYSFGQDLLFFAINPLAYADVWTRIWTAFEIAFIYISKTFIPWNLSASYHYNALPLINNIFNSWEAVAGLVLIIFALYKRVRNSPFGLGALAFLIPYLVISKFIFKGGDLVAERWIYFPFIGLSLIGGFFNLPYLSKEKVAGHFSICLFAFSLCMGIDSKEFSLEICRKFV